MGLAINLCVLVVVTCGAWTVLMWITDRQPRPRGRTAEYDEVAYLYEPDQGSCDQCDGCGALVRRRGIEPCPECEGTGVCA